MNLGGIIDLGKIYKEMATPLHMKAAAPVIGWRNKRPSFLRKIATGVALASLGIAGLIDVVARIALTILTAPAELAGYQFARSFAKGVMIGGALSGFLLTIMQWANTKPGLI